MGAYLSSNQSFTLEMLSAEHGDCLLISARGGSISTNIVVDCGPAGTYQRALRAKLQALASAGEAIDLLVVTHVDNDHIQGAIEFLEENGTASSPRIIEVREVWHNSYRHLPTGQGGVPTADQTSRVRAQCQWVKPNSQGLVGAKEGSSLALLLQHFGYNWNGAFGGGPVVSGRSTSVGNLLIQVLSPSEDELEKLLYWWRKELVQMGVGYDAIASLEFETPFELRLCQRPEPEPEPARDISFSGSTEVPAENTFKPDKSKVNGSSIVLLVEFAGIKLLLLGDSPTGDLDKRWPISLPIAVRAVKVSHHGSRSNTAPSFLGQVKAQQFLISANGKNGHPHLDSLLRIVSSQPECQLIFNYDTRQSQFLSSKEVIEKFKHSTIVSDGNFQTSISIDLAAKHT